MIQKLGPRFIYPLAERYVKRDISSKRAIISHRLKLSGEIRLGLMKRALVDLVSHAKETVPYYREVLKSYDPRKLEKDIGYIRDIPLLTKEIILKDPPRFISSDFSGKFLHQRKTGGSTGPSALIYYSQEDLDWTAAVNLSLDHYTGRGIYDKEVHISAEFDETPSAINRVYGYVKQIAMNRVNVFVRELDNESMRKLMMKLAVEDAYIVQAHPSTIYALSNYMAGRIRLKRPLFKFFESTGEAISLEQVTHIEANIGCKVFNRYGSAEFGVIAHSTEDPTLLEVLESVVYPEEIENSEGMSELVLTGLLNRAMPLIRYQSGDSARVMVKDHIFMLSHLRGRVHDVVRVCDRLVATHYIQDVLDKIGAHKEFQILYEGHRKTVTKILVVPNDDTKDPKALELALEKYLGKQVAVIFVGFEDLVKVGWREKFRRAVEDPDV